MAHSVAPTLAVFCEELATRAGKGGVDDPCWTAGAAWLEYPRVAEVSGPSPENSLVEAPLSSCSSPLAAVLSCGKLDRTHLGTNRTLLSSNP